MERKFHQDDFEHFLKDNADDLRMKPSGAVWEGISKELNRKKRRVAGFLLVGLTLLSGGLFTWYTLHLPEDAVAMSPVKTRVQTAAEYPATTIDNSGKNFKTFQPEKPQQKPVTDAAAPKPTGNKLNGGPAQSPSVPTATIFSAPLSETYHEATNEQLADNEVDVATSRTPTAPAVLLKAGKNNGQPQLHISQHKATEIIQQAKTAEPDAVAAAIPTLRKKRLLRWSVFATPTVSYRKLSENKTFDRPFLTPGTPPMVSALYNINNAVIHKPDLGLEFGVAAKYALTKKLKLRSGFQFNISRYDIKAFSYIPEVATIALSNGLGVDSVRAVSNYRNFNNGSRYNWLQNMYFQASLPVGLEYEVVGNEKVKWNIGGAIQPTYVIGNRSYMITADYKNYARVPWLTRHWNMNTNVETFVSFQSGKTEWHIGPQMRYQVLSSFVKKYPVKENLFDFGMKVGVTIR